MKTLLSILAAVAFAVPAQATPESPDFINGGQCAGDVYSKCRYTLDVVNPNETMILTPGLEYLGASRISTIEACVEETGVTDYMNLMTDSELEGFEACLISYE